MQNDDETGANRGGISPPQKAEQIYHEWLKRPRSGGEVSENGNSVNQSKKEPDEISGSKPQSASEARWQDDGGEGG